MNANSFIDFLKGLMDGFLGVGSWLTTPLVTLGDFTFSPILLFTFGGLTAFITVAIIKWIAS